MAYMNQEKKKKIAEAMKVALKGTGVKYTLGVHNHSTIVMNITQAPVDFMKNYNETVRQRVEDTMLAFHPAVQYMQLNDFHYREQFTGKALELLSKIVPTLNTGNHDNSDIQSDYFDVGWYVSVNIGKFDKPFIVA